MENGKTILVTGGCGFIGSNLVRYLFRETNHKIVNCDSLTYAGNRQSLYDLEDDQRYTWADVDIADHAAVSDLIQKVQPDFVMHLAAESHVDRSIDGPDRFVQTNLVGTFNLLDACRKQMNKLAESDFRFLHVSTDEVYGSLGETGKFSETTRYDPHSPYSATKAGSDHLARAWFDTYGLPVIVTNCSNNYGPYQFPEKLIPLMVIKGLAEEPLPVYGDGSNVRDWLYVEDHVKALWIAVTQGSPGETYNIGGDSEKSNLELVHTLCDTLDELRPRVNGSYRDLIQFVTDRPGHDFRYAIDASKIKNALDWNPSLTFDQGLRSTIEWYLENEGWWKPIIEGTYQLERLGGQS